MLKDGRRSLRRRSWKRRNFIVRGLSLELEVEAGGDKTEVGKLNLLCDTLRAWVSSTSVACLSLSLFFSTTLSRCCGTSSFSPLLLLLLCSREFRVTRELSRNGIFSLSLVSSFLSKKKKKKGRKKERKREKLPFPRFFHRLLPRRVDFSKLCVSASLFIPTLSPLCTFHFAPPPLRSSGNRSRCSRRRFFFVVFGLKRMTKFSK